MGNGGSKEEQLYQAVQNGNTGAVEALVHEGVSLQFVDNVGRTPLHVACTRGDLFDMALTLLNLGADVKAYQPGTHGGYPLHQAAKLGLDGTVFLLLQRGADPLAVNEDVVTPLDLARNRGHLSVVRMIEDRIAIFSGMLREMAGPGIIEQFAPQWVMKKIWAVVVPTESDPRKPSKPELVIYLSPKNALPHTLIPLSSVDVEEPKFTMSDPVLVLTERNKKTKHKFLAEAPGDKAQLERLYKACKVTEQTTPNMPSQAVLQGLSALIRPATQQQQPEPSSSIGPNPSNLEQPSESDVALQVAMEASLRTAAEEAQRLGENQRFSDWGDGHENLTSEFNGWKLSAEPGPSTTPHVANAEISRETAPTSSAPPSAPPISQLEHVESGPIAYPSIDTSPVEIDYSTYAAKPDRPSAPSSTMAEGNGSQGGLCVVCWDVPVEAVCIPCGHLAGCVDCLSAIKEKGSGCPVCRASIQQVVKVFSV